MRLKSLNIALNLSWQPNPGQYSGKIEYEGEKGSFTLNLDTVLSARVLAEVGEAAEETSRITLANLNASISDSINASRGLQIEAPKAESEAV